MHKATIHTFSSAQEGEGVYAGSRWLPILGCGDIQLQVQDYRNKPRILDLNGVTYCPQMGTNPVPLNTLRRIDYWWNQRDNKDVIRHINGFCGKQVGI